MSFKLTRSNKVMGGVIIALALILFVREGCNQGEKNDLVEDIITYKDSAQYYNLKVDGLEVEVAYNKSLVLENDKQVKSVLSSINDTIAKLVKKFKNITSGTIINNYTTINNDTIKLRGDSIPCDFKPFKVRRDSIHYLFVGTIARNYFLIDTIFIPNQQSLIVGNKKVGLFKGSEGFLRNKERRAEIINSNPLVKVTNIKSYVVEPDKNRFGFGFHAGYGFQLNKGIMSASPQFGISLNYNLYEF